MSPNFYYFLEYLGISEENADKEKFSQLINSFIETNKLVQGINKFRHNNSEFKAYINENGNLDSIYENDRYKPAIEINYRGGDYAELYLFDGKIVEGHPYSVETMHVPYCIIINIALSEDRLKNVMLYKSGGLGESWEYLYDKDHKDIGDMRLYKTTENLDDYIVMAPINFGFSFKFAD